MDAPIVIAGGDAAGMSAASKIKRDHPDAHVIVFERSPHISYSACGMPYWIGGVVESDRRLMVLTPESARKKRGIEVRIFHEVTSIDPVRRVAQVKDVQNCEFFEQPYSKLCVATGARAICPPIPGIELPGVFTLRALHDAQKIHAYMQAKTLHSALIIGGGYIGIEMLEAMRDRFLNVHLVEHLPQIMPNLDADMVAQVAIHLAEKGVNLHLEAKVTSIAQQDGQLIVQTDKAGAFEVDLVIVAVGVEPNSELAANAGLRLGVSKAIEVDSMFRTSDPDIFAAGDCVAHHHLVLGRNVWIPLATSANKGGRIAGENMMGGTSAFPGILGTAIVKAFDYTVAVTGLTERDARKSGLFGADGEFAGATVIETKDRANYWPGAESLKVKLVFDKRSGRVLGSQLVGKDGVNKRIDIVATAISAKMTLNDLTMLDLSYAPPYSTSHDPIQVCASVAQRELLPAQNS